MSEEMSRHALEKISQSCIMCGTCRGDCAFLHDLGMFPAEIAKAVLNSSPDEKLLAAVMRCDLCGRCSHGCSENVNPAEMFRCSRELLMIRGKITLNTYDAMLVNRDWNEFSLYRASFGIEYSDLERRKFDILFFPGCTLSTYAPELTRAAFSWLEQRGPTVGFTDLCCAKPLDSIGLIEEVDRYLLRLRLLLERAGTRALVTACSNCQAHLKEHLPDLEIQSIFNLMRQDGIVLGGPEVLTFHDSCPDRNDPRNPADVRALLGGYRQVEMASHGANTVCCGSGGIVSMIDPNLSAERARTRLGEFAASGADCCITSCMACAHRLSRAGATSKVRHCLEKVFDTTLDYAQIGARTRSLWAGELGEQNLQRLACARDLDLFPEGQ